MKRKSPSQIKPLLTIAYYSLRAQLRNKATVFFGFSYPIMFIGVFGLFGSSGVSISVGISAEDQTGPVYQVISSIESVKIVTKTDNELREDLTSGQIDGILLLDSANNGQVQAVISQANQEKSSAVISIISGVVDKLNLEITGIKDPPIKFDVQEISGRDFKFIDFFLPGIIGFAVLSTAVTNTAFGLVFLKKTLVLKRIFATPTKGATILLGQSLARLVIVLAQTLIILGMGIFVFDFNLVNGFTTVLNVFILSVIGLLAFLGFGLFVAGLSNDENTIAPVAQLMILPQFLVAGTFFPIESLPSWAQPIVNLLPLAFFNNAIRKITIDGFGFEHLLPQLLGLAIWAAIAYIAAARTFKWE